VDNKALNDENMSIKENFNRLSLENQNNKDNFIKIEQDFKEFKSKFDNVLNDNTQLTNSNTKLEQSIQLSEKTNGELTLSLTRSESTIKALNEEIESYQIQKKDYESNIIILNQKNTELIQDLEVVKRDLSSSGQQNEK